MMNPLAQMSLAGQIPPSTLDYLDPRTASLVAEAMRANPGLQLKSFYGERLYDTARVQSGTALTAQDINLFSVPQGNQTTEVNGTTAYTKTKLDTNMTVSRQLPAGQLAWITSIQIRVLFVGSLDDSVQTGANLGLANAPGTNTSLAAADDVVAVTNMQAILESFVITFQYNQTNFESGPLYLFPTRYVVSGVAGAVNIAAVNDQVIATNSIIQNETVLNNGMGIVWTLPIVRKIEPLYQFNVLLQPINLFTPNRNFRIQCILEGLGAKAVTG